MLLRVWVIMTIIITTKITHQLVLQMIHCLILLQFIHLPLPSLLLNHIILA